MENTKSSYEFHCQLESFSVFCRREWKSIAVCGGAFLLAMLAAIFFIDPAFFYSRLSTDPLNYYLKARAFAETGGTAAVAAVNLKPFAYAAMPGVLRSPFLLMFRDFDNQLRAMQVFNTIILVSVALMSAFVLSWAQPPRRHRYVIAFAFAFTLLSPVWLANVFLPLADAPYVAFSLAALLVLVRILCSVRPSRKAGSIALFAILFGIAFLVRFTGPLLLVYAAVLAHGRWGLHKIPRRAWLTPLAITMAVLVALTAMNVQAIFGKYFFEPLWYVVKGDKLSMIANLLAVAFPSQVIPNFQLGFVHPPIEAHYATKFTESPIDTAWMMVGVLIASIIIAGMWRARDRFMPGIAYVLAPLPLLAPILPSTTRYMMSYQAFIWIFFYLGAVAFAERTGLVVLLRRRTFVVVASALIVSGIVGLRWWKVAGGASESVLAVTVTKAAGYINGVSGTFRGLRDFIETLPADRTLLIGDSGTSGRWKIISNRDYYDPDPSLPAVVPDRDVYLLVECGTLDTCQSWDYHKDRVQKRVSQFGDFKFASVYAAQSPRARVEVFRVRNSR